MCARYEHTVDLPGIVRELEAIQIATAEQLRYPRWNIGPTSTSAIVRVNADGAREVVAARWGLVPPWATDTTIAQKTINARAETVFEKPSFRAAAKARRCLVTRLCPQSRLSA